MRLYIISACTLAIALLLFLSVRQNLFTQETLPLDDEQTGLNANIIINFSHVVSENTPKGAAALKFAELVREKSDGHILVEIHPNGILFNDETEIAALQEGKVQMIAPTFSKVTAIAPEWNVLDLPFLFDSYEQAYSVMHSEFGEQLLAQLQQQNIKGLTFWQNGFKQIATQQQPILEVTDFQGVTIRTMMASHVLQQQFETLQAQPVMTSFNDLYHKIEQGDVMAQENTLSNLFSKGFYELQNEITLSNHGVLAYAVMMNETFWAQLTDDEQAIIEEALQEMSIWQYEQAKKMNEEALVKLKMKDTIHVHTLTENQRTAWQQALQPLYKQFQIAEYETLWQQVE